MLSFQGRLDAALDAYDVAANLNPNEPDILALIASLETFKGNHDEAVRKTEAAMRGNPFYPSWYADGLASLRTEPANEPGLTSTSRGIMRGQSPPPRNPLASPRQGS